MEKPKTIKKQSELQQQKMYMNNEANNLNPHWRK